MIQSALFPLVYSALYPNDTTGCNTLMRPPIPFLRALLFGPESTRLKLVTQCVAFVRPWAYLFKDTCLIFGLELLALTAFSEHHAPSLAGRSVWIYMDSNNFLSAVARGDSNIEEIAILGGRLWAAIQRYRICAWFSTVHSGGKSARPTY